MDFDGDGDTDIISGSFPGELFVFRRGDDGQFAAPEVIENKHGGTRLRGRDGNRPSSCYNATVFLHDWDGDGDGDLLVGRNNRLLVSNEGTLANPVFGAAEPLQLDGNAIPRGFIQPVVADWDNDGRDDLLAGSGYDIVWYRNMSQKGPPVLAAPKILVPASAVKAFGSSRRHDEPVKLPDAPALATGICVADFNGDGSPDLLLGDYFAERVQFPEPTAEQLAMMAKAGATRASLSSGLQLMRMRAPEDEARQERIERYRKAVDDWRVWHAATNAAKEFRAKRYVRHGWVWLYSRVAVQDDAP